MGKRPKVREKLLDVAILNLKLHSEIANKYERLFELLSAVQHAKVRGNEYGTIGFVRRIDEEALYGEIYLFLNIDPSLTWWDAEKRIPVESDALGMETRIFDRLKPHLKEKPYLFDLRNHRLFFDSKGFNPNSARRFFEGLCRDAKIAEQLGPVDIEIHSSLESIEQVLSTPNMTSLEIFISLPNPEDLTADQEVLYEDLRAEGTLKYREIRKSTEEIGITPNERTTNLVQISRTEGYSRATGIDEGQPISRFSQQHPEKIKEPYLVLTETPRDALLRVADTIYNNLFGR